MKRGPVLYEEFSSGNVDAVILAASAWMDSVLQFVFDKHIAAFGCAVERVKHKGIQTWAVVVFTGGQVFSEFLVSDEALAEFLTETFAQYCAENIGYTFMDNGDNNAPQSPN